MKNFMVFLLLLLSLNGCGSDSKSSLRNVGNTAVSGVSDTITEEEFESNRTHNPNETVTVYVHGFSPNGADRSGVYGADKKEGFFNDIPSFIALPTINNEEDVNKINVFAATTYYGDTPPDYYTPEDIAEIETITAEHGGGIPRYAMIVAKYAKHLLDRTGAKQVNFVSASMGALVSRYMIEKNLENLASEKKIARWLTIEGVLNGNYAASKDELIDIVKLFEPSNIDVKHMNHDWVSRNISPSRKIGTSPYYKDILIGHETSTSDRIQSEALTALLLINGQYEPNDGYQVVSDTYFQNIPEAYRFEGQLPTHTYFHETHLGIKDKKGAWAEIATFITSNKRVKLTLEKAKVTNIQERDKKLFGKTIYKKLPAEIVFSSKIYSPEVKNRWKINDEISNIDIHGAVPSVVKYRYNGEQKNVNQVLFDDFVLDNEKELQVALDVKEIDGDIRYAVYESLRFRDHDYDNIGTDKVTVPLKDGVYSFSNGAFSYTIKVEMINYSFPLLGETEVSIKTLLDATDYFYKNILERKPIVDEQRVALRMLRDNNDDLSVLAKELMLSDEFNMKSLTNEEFIAKAKSALTLNGTLENFDENISRESVVDKILTSKESKALMASLLGSSGGEEPNALLERGQLVHYEKVESKNASYMQQLYKSTLEKYPALDIGTQYGVEAYKVVYTTVDKNGEKINASGLVTIPLGVNEPLSLVSEQHGTMFGDRNAPSVHKPLTTTGALISTLRGYAVAMPDYIGYGITSKHYHPYQVKENIAPVVVDMILASKELMKKQNIEHNEKLFLTGYSEGGYATMAAAELLEKEYQDLLPVTAVAPMAGSYAMKETADYILNLEEYPTPEFALFLLYSYNRYYEWDNLQNILQDNVFTDINNFIAEKEKGNIVATNFPKKRSELYKETFISSYQNGEESLLNDSLTQNSLLDWQPTVPMHLYHCTGDKVVPALNSQIAYDTFVKNGSTSVELILNEGGTHNSCSIPTYIQAFTWFEGLR